jgi:hypothetical protein
MPPRIWFTLWYDVIFSSDATAIGHKKIPMTVSFRVKTEEAHYFCYCRIPGNKGEKWLKRE